MNLTTTSHTITCTPCSHRMPCGWCDLKNEQCTYTYTVPYWNTDPIKVTPTWDKDQVACGAGDALARATIKGVQCGTGADCSTTHCSGSCAGRTLTEG